MLMCLVCTQLQSSMKGKLNGASKPSLPLRTVDTTEDEDQPWYSMRLPPHCTPADLSIDRFHGTIAREDAEQMLSRNMIGGLFLVRQRSG